MGLVPEWVWRRKTVLAKPWGGAAAEVGPERAAWAGSESQEGLLLSSLELASPSLQCAGPPDSRPPPRGPPRPWWRREEAAGGAPHRAAERGCAVLMLQGRCCILRRRPLIGRAR